MNFEQLDEYLLELQNYQEGIYTNDTLTSTLDIIKAIESGRKIVFLKSKLEAKVLFIWGGIFLVLGIILTIFLSPIFREFWIFPFSIFFGVFGGIGLICIVLGLLKMRTSFIVLGPEGIVYKMLGGSIKGHKWEDISLDIGGTTSIQINILMPDGDFIKLEPEDYQSAHFIKTKSYLLSIELYIFTFLFYYKRGKYKSKEINHEEDLDQIIKAKPRAEGSIIVKAYSLEDLRKEYYKYREKKYEFGYYGTKEQLKNEFSKGKVFILKGGLRGADWILVILLFAMGLITGIILSFFYIGSGVFMFCFLAFFSSLSFIKLRYLLVISPSGVFYRKILSSGDFSWNHVNNIKGIIRTYIDFSWAIVTISTSFGRKIKFSSNSYLNKEFPKKAEMEMFFSLFYIYSQKGKTEISKAFIQKTVSHSQLKELLLSSVPKSEGSRLKAEELQTVLPISDKKKEKTKINSNTKSTKFPPISELMQKIGSPVPKNKTSQMISGESQPTPSFSDENREKKLLEEEISKTPEGGRKDSLIDLKEKIQLNVKAREMLDRGIKILEEIMKNDEEYKILLTRKEAGESVEDQIKQNRNYADILAKEDKERSREAIKWGKSEEAAKWFELIEETRRMNPALARDSDIRLKHGLKLANEIKKNEEEYENLLKRKNNGEYVDDLIKQNRYTAQILAEQNKKVWD